MHLLDNALAIKTLDKKNMLESLQLLGAQVKQIWPLGEKIKVPKDYNHFDKLVVLGMGGSALGAGIVKSVYAADLKVPLTIIGDYNLPRWIDERTLVIASSYSGTTEETLTTVKAAARQKAKIAVITSGGELKKIAAAKHYPAIIYTTKNNPCGSPRTSLGYNLIGLMLLMHKFGLLPAHDLSLNKISKCLFDFETDFGVFTPAKSNPAKQLAEELVHRSVWYVAGGHLSGSAHVAANQMNENAKRYGGYWLLPEINHHLMEGLKFPKSNPDQLAFVALRSKLYDRPISRRLALTEEVLEKNKILVTNYQCRSKTKLLQVLELLVLGSYISFYSAVLSGIDPTPNPFVDYFKARLKK